MGRQQAIHTIRHEWVRKDDSWGNSEGNVEVTLIDRYFECGKLEKYVRFPEDQPPTEEQIAEVKARKLPLCKKCEKVKSKKKVQDNRENLSEPSKE